MRGTIASTLCGPSGIVRMNWRALAAGISAALSLITAEPAQAFMIPPPTPLLIRFEPASAELTPAGTLAADRLAIRAARCRDGRLRVLLRHRAGISLDLLLARFRAVRKRLAMLGIDAIYVNRLIGDINGVGAEGAWASVTSGEDEYCSGVDSSLLQHWADQLAHAQQSGGQAPQFWLRMTLKARRDELALVLAATSYCAAPESDSIGGHMRRCTLRPEAFEWLAERTARQQPGDQRRRWVEILWSAATPSTLVRWQRQLDISTLSPDSVLPCVSALVASDLPWDEIERRLLTPGLMNRVGREAMYARFPFAGDVVFAATSRGQLDTLPRLIKAAGEQADGLYWEIVLAAASAKTDAEFEQLISLLPASFTAGRWNDRLTELLMAGASCPGAAPGSPPRYAQIWERLRSSGFQPDRQTFESLTSAASPQNQGSCRIEAVPDEPYHFRRMARTEGATRQPRESHP